MGPGEAAKLIGIDRTTVTKWTSHEYKRYMTPGAQGGTGKTRVLTDRDLRVLHLLKTLKFANTPPEEIHATLQQLESDGWEGLPDMPEAPPGVAEFPIMPTAAADATISAERRAFMREIATLQERVKQLENKLDEERASRDAEVRDLMRELSGVNAELARTKALLDLYDQGRLKPEG